MNKSLLSFRALLISAIITLFVVSCAGKDNAVLAIEKYITALVEKDADLMRNLSCADWEQNAQVEVDSLTAVSSAVDNLSCEKTGQDGENVFIDCTGVIALDYGGEAQQIDLSGRTYIARQEGGEWRMCGYK